MAPRETENNGYAKFWGDKQGALWYVMVFSGVVNWDNREKVYKDAKSIFQRRYHGRRRCRIVKSLLTGKRRQFFSL